MRLFAVAFTGSHLADLAEAAGKFRPRDTSLRGEQCVQGGVRIARENVQGFADQFRVQKGSGEFLHG